MSKSQNDVMNEVFFTFMLAVNFENIGLNFCTRIYQPLLLNPRPDTVFRHLRSDRGGGGVRPPLAFPNEAS